MQWTERWTPWPRLRSVTAEVAESLIESCFQAVWQRVEQRVLEMPPAEAAGYVRARAALVIRRRLELIIAERGTAGLNPARAYALASNSLVQRVVAQAQAQPPQRVVLQRAA